ncbi:cytochrome P450 [Metabacillus herbersteinensis]|uniref:Cytochrome P450 n=1 Tax=Metabacillus herbersteinensis TaxID=283816 RepID=A0ABV6GB39_9BACI
MTRITAIDGSRISNFLWFQRDPLSFLLHASKLGDMVSIEASKKYPTYVVSAPDLIKEILVTKDKYFEKGRAASILSRTVGNGLLTSEGETHRRQQKMIRPAFYKEHLLHYANKIVQKANATDFQVEKEFNMSQRMMELTLEIITVTMFGKEVGEKKAEIAESVDTIIYQAAKTLFSPLPIPFKFPTPGNRKHHQSNEKINEFIYQLISDQKKTGATKDTLLHMLLATTYENGESLPEEEIRDQLVTMLLAGHETTATALTWAWYLLAKHPEIEEKFHEELTNKLGGRQPTFEDVRDLPYTETIFQETIRLYPPAWIILRESLSEVEVGGDTYPRKTTFMISPFAIHRKPPYFDEAEKFLPERFMDHPSPPTFSYFPFSGGPRACIGSNFAMMEAILILATIGQKYRFRLVEPQDIELVPLVSLRVKGGLNMVANSR